MTRYFGIVVVLSLSFIGNAVSNDEKLLVTTNYGKVEGTTLTPENATLTCHGFIGVPFAKPPIGDLRFQKPEPMDPWSNVLETKESAARCIQLPGSVFFPGPENVDDSEDCLYLNIVLPSKDIRTENLYPVMVWIHGGGFVVGSSFEYEPDEICRNLVSRDVIVVSVQYRLGVFGFLATGDDSAPGNYGLHDQILALKWVHENIENFGGDPNRVTIFGESAGGASVSLLNYIPRVEPYYAHTIAQSGSAFGYWVVNSRSIESFHKLATALGCGDKKVENRKKLDCINKMTTEEINAAHAESFEHTMIPSKKKKPGKSYPGGGYGVAALYIRWTPTIDKDLIPAGGVAEMKPNAKPLMTGTTEQEMLGVIKPTPVMKQFIIEDDTEAPMYIYDDEELEFSTMEKNLQEAIFVARNPWKGQYFDSDKAQRGPADYAAEFAYITALGGKNNKTFLGRQIVQLANDMMFNVPCILDAEHKKRAGSPVWLYSFDHYREIDYPEEREWKAAGHAAELPMLFTRLSKFLPGVFDDKDSQVREITCKLWTNFAKHGRPNGDIEWPQYESTEKPVHLKIKVDSEVSDNYHRPTVPFWTILFPEFNGKKENKGKKHEEL